MNSPFGTPVEVHQLWTVSFPRQSQRWHLSLLSGTVLLCQSMMSGSSSRSPSAELCQRRRSGRCLASIYGRWWYWPDGGRGWGWRRWLSRWHNHRLVQWSSCPQSQRNSHRATVTEQQARSNRHGATGTEQQAQSNRHRATGTEKQSQSNRHRETVTEQQLQRRHSLELHVCEIRPCPVQHGSSSQTTQENTHHFRGMLGTHSRRHLTQVDLQCNINSANSPWKYLQ